MTKTRLPIIAFMLILSCGNFARLSGNENIRAIQYFSLLTIGALLALLIQQIAALIKKK